MTPELIGIVAVGVALAGLLLVSNRALRAEMRDVRAEMRDMRAEIAVLRSDMTELRERMARIEGMFEGFLRREPEPAAA